MVQIIEDLTIYLLTVAIIALLNPPCVSSVLLPVVSALVPVSLPWTQRWEGFKVCVRSPHCWVLCGCTQRF